MFYALAKGLIDTGRYSFEHTLSDIQSLNDDATRAVFDVTALSVAAYPRVADKYQILSCGASMGDGYGPVVVSREPLSHDDLARATIAIPGLQTSAYLALRLFLHPYEPAVYAVKFDEIEARVLAGEYDAGLLIHEGQITYGDEGLKLVADLGAWWKDETGLPLPLGINAIKRDIPEDAKRDINRVLKESVAYALTNQYDALEYALSFARGLPAADAKRFINMYVNDLTLNMGETGLQTIRLFLERSDVWTSTQDEVIDVLFVDDNG
jgi:1,4-dihydroxy-6-naphthoate synthase